MDRFRTLTLLGAVLALVALLPACSGDDDNPTNTGNTGGAPPTFDGGDIAFTPPTALQSSSDPYAQQAVAYVNMLNAVTSYTGNLQPPPDKAVLVEKAGPWVYNWSISDGMVQMNFTLTITELADRFTWEYRITGTDGETAFDNALVYAAQVAKDESWGWFEWYDFTGSSDASWRWDWLVDGSVTTFTMEFTDGEDGLRLELVGNDDGSGTLDYFEGSPSAWNLFLHIAWTAAGAGDWISYDGEGNVVDSGSWSAVTAVAVPER